MRRLDFIGRVNAEFSPSAGHEAGRALRALGALGGRRGSGNPPFTPDEMALILLTVALARVAWVTVRQAAAQAVDCPDDRARFRDALLEPSELVIERRMGEGDQVNGLVIPARLLRRLTGAGPEAGR